MPGATSSRTGASSQTFGLELGLQLLCQAKKGVGAGCSGLRQLLQAGWAVPHQRPAAGDQIFFTKDGGKSFCHTGIVEKVAGGRVYTIEGNTSSAAGVVENGGCVQDKSYPLTYSKIGGYGRPDFSIVPEEDNDMDQTKFNEMFAAAMAEYRKQLRDNDSGDWSQKAREWAVSVGLFAGNGTLDNGEPNMMWEDFLTREPGRPALLSFRLGAWAGVMGRGKRLAQARAHRRLEFSKRLSLIFALSFGS